MPRVSNIFCAILSFITLNQGDNKRSLYSDTWPMRGINFVVLIEVQLDTHMVLSDDLISSQLKNQNGNQIHPGPTGMSHVRLMMRGMPKFGYLRKKYLL